MSASATIALAFGVTLVAVAIDCLSVLRRRRALRAQLAAAAASRDNP
jgi:heme exporter protein CcmD